MKYELIKDGGLATVKFYGGLSERSEAPLAELSAALGKRALRLDLSAVMRVATGGEGIWRAFLTEMTKKASSVEIVAASVDFIEAVNKNPELVRGARLVSFHAPVRCPSCAHAAAILIETAKVSPSSSFGAPPCGKCGRGMEPSVPPAAYFSFLFGD